MSLKKIYVGTIAERDMNIFAKIKELCRINYNIKMVNILKRGKFKTKRLKKKLRKYPISFFIVKLHSGRKNEKIFDALRKYAPQIPVLNSLSSIEICDSRRATFKFLEDHCPKLKTPKSFYTIQNAYEACKKGMEIIVKLDVHNIPKEERIAGIAKSPEQLLELTKGFSDEDLFFQESLGKLDIVYKVYVIDDYAVSIIRKNRLRKYNLSPLQLVYMRAPIEKKLKKRILKIGEELRMPIYGVDYVEKNGTPYIVDVNNFPSYRNIPEALSLISDHIYNVLNISDYHYDLMKTITV